MQKAFAYLRVSGRGQVDGDGFPRQEKAIKAYAKAHDIQLVRIFREEGVSGTNDLENRPALSALVEALHSNGIKLVLVEALHRLARDLMIQESIIGDFKRKGFELVSVTEPDLCSNEPTRVLFRQMMGAFSQYEKSMIVSKLKGARERMKVKTGRCEGRKPYGFYSSEQLALNRMKELRESGAAYDRISDTLNQEGFKPRTAQRKGQECRWHPGVVRRILKATAILSSAVNIIGHSPV